MVRGSVVVHPRRCGKPNCKCASGEALHKQVLLSYSLDGRPRSVSLPEDLVEAVSAATTRYRQARLAIEAQGTAGLETLIGRLSAKR